MKIDSTSQRTVYGSVNTVYTRYEKVLMSDTTYFKLDTLPTLYSKFEYVDKLKRRYQDLGNLGSALHPVFLEKTKEIGNTPGYEAYDLYFMSPDSTRFFDTKSPYTQLDIYLAGSNRNKVDVTFARSINPRWNVGFDFQSITAAKQISGRGRDDLYVSAFSLGLFTRYESKNKKYKLLTSVSRTRHAVKESGGLVPIEISPKNSYYGYNSSAAVWTNTAESVFSTTQWRYYHEYAFDPHVVLYHQFDTYNKGNEYEDSDPIGGGNANEVSTGTEPSTDTTTDVTRPPGDADDTSTDDETPTTDENILNNPLYRLYPYQLFQNKGSTVDRNVFLYNQNIVGVKGKYSGLFYAIYTRQKVWRNEFSILPNTSKAYESYFGGKFKYGHEKYGDVTVDGEIGDEGQFLGQVAVNTPWLELNYQRSSRIAPLLYNHNFTHFSLWENDFGQEQKQYISGRLKFKFKKFKFNLVGTLVDVTNPFLINADRVPEQFDVTASQLQTGIEWDMKFLYYFHWSGNALYTNNLSNGHLIPAPEIFTWQELYFESIIFNHVMQAEIGFNVHWKSDYYPMAYDQHIHSFYLQNDFEVPGYPVIDFFWRFKVRRARATIKILNIKQAIESPQEGYFATPFYTGLPFLFDIGFGWMFFD